MSVLPPILDACGDRHPWSLFLSARGRRVHSGTPVLNHDDRREVTNDEAKASDRDPYLLAQVRESFGRVVYSHKTHEKQADISFTRHQWPASERLADGRRPCAGRILDA